MTTNVKFHCTIVQCYLFKQSLSHYVGMTLEKSDSGVNLTGFLIEQIKCHHHDPGNILKLNSRTTCCDYVFLTVIKISSNMLFMFLIYLMIRWRQWSRCSVRKTMSSILHRPSLWRLTLCSPGEKRHYSVKTAEFCRAPCHWKLLLENTNELKRFAYCFCIGNVSSVHKPLKTLNS